MLYIGIREMLRSWKQSLLMVVQVGLIMFLTVAAVTVYREQSVKYSYLKDLLKKDGFVSGLNLADVNEAGGLDKLMRIKGIDEFHCVFNANFKMSGRGGAGSIEFYAYDELFSKYVPELSEGRWFTKKSGNGKTIEAVVSSNSYGLKYGDTVECYYGSRKVSLHICGVLSDKANIFVKTRSLSSYDSLFDFYSSYDASREDGGGILFTSINELEDAGITPYYYGNFFGVFSENTPERSRQRIMNEFRRNNVVIEFSELRERTEEDINRKISAILPVALGAFVMVILGIASLSAIDTLNSRRSYAVFFSCGMRWEKAMRIAMIKAAITCLLGAVVMFLLRFISVLTKLDKTFMFELGFWQIFACFCVALLMVAVSALVSGYLLKNNQPADVLRESRY